MTAGRPASGGGCCRKLTRPGVTVALAGRTRRLEDAILETPAMTRPPFVLLFVADPDASARFYAELLGRPPVERSPTFALFALAGGAMLGLWSSGTADPRPDALPGAAEIGFPVPDEAAVDATHAAWAARGVAIRQAPVTAEFGRTFLAADPDGHRLRVFAPPAG